MYKLLITILLSAGFIISSSAHAFEGFNKLVPTLYYKIPLSLNSKTIKEEQRVGFSLNYQATTLSQNEQARIYQPPAFIDFSHTMSGSNQIHINGIRILNINNRLNVEEGGDGGKISNWFWVGLLGVALYIDHNSDYCNTQYTWCGGE